MVKSLPFAAANEDEKWYKFQRKNKSKKAFSLPGMATIRLLVYALFLPFTSFPPVHPDMALTGYTYEQNVVDKVT